MQGKNIKAQIIKHYQYLSDRVAFVTAEMVRNAYQGMGSEYETLLGAFDKDIENFKKRVGKDRTKSTLSAMKLSRGSVADFIQAHYRRKDISMLELTPDFIASLAEIAVTTIKNVAQWLVWVAKEIGHLTDMELHRADSEVGDIVDGKYDWRIEKLENHNGLTR